MRWKRRMKGRYSCTMHDVIEHLKPSDLPVELFGPEPIEVQNLCYATLGASPPFHDVPLYWA